MMDTTMNLSRPRLSASRRNKCQALGLPLYSLGEEVFSSVSHGVSALISVASLVLLLIFCEKIPVKVVSTAVYGAMMVVLFAASAMVFRSIDHCTIFLLIAGTYTPITLVCLGGAQGWAMFGVVWAAALAGIILNAISVERFKVFSMICYLAMGWVVVFAMGTLWTNLSGTGFWCLLAGGVLYTVGAVLYGFGKRVPYMHSVFHLFVLAGSVLHTISVYQVVK